MEAKIAFKLDEVKFTCQRFTCYLKRFNRIFLCEKILNDKYFILDEIVVNKRNYSNNY